MLIHFAFALFVLPHRIKKALKHACTLTWSVAWPLDVCVTLLTCFISVCWRIHLPCVVMGRGQPVARLRGKPCAVLLVGLEAWKAGKNNLFLLLVAEPLYKPSWGASIRRLGDTCKGQAHICDVFVLGLKGAARKALFSSSLPLIYVLIVSQRPFSHSRSITATRLDWAAEVLCEGQPSFFYILKLTASGLELMRRTVWLSVITHAI